MYRRARAGKINWTSSEARLLVMTFFSPIYIPTGSQSVLLRSLSAALSRARIELRATTRQARGGGDDGGWWPRNVKVLVHNRVSLLNIWHNFLLNAGRRVNCVSRDTMWRGDGMGWARKLCWALFGLICRDSGRCLVWLANKWAVPHFGQSIAFWGGGGNVEELNGLCGPQ